MTRHERAERLLLGVKRATKQGFCHKCHTNILAGDLVVDGREHADCTPAIARASAPRAVKRYGCECATCGQFFERGEMIEGHPYKPHHVDCISAIAIDELIAAEQEKLLDAQLGIAYYTELRLKLKGGA